MDADYRNEPHKLLISTCIDTLHLHLKALYSYIMTYFLKPWQALHTYI